MHTWAGVVISLNSHQVVHTQFVGLLEKGLQVLSSQRFQLRRVGEKVKTLVWKVFTWKTLKDTRKNSESSLVYNKQY